MLVRHGRSHDNDSINEFRVAILVIHEFTKLFDRERVIGVIGAARQEFLPLGQSLANLNLSFNGCHSTYSLSANDHPIQSEIAAKMRINSPSARVGR